jgi:hypothetical protein
MTEPLRIVGVTATWLVPFAVFLILVFAVAAVGNAVMGDLAGTSLLVWMIVGGFIGIRVAGKTRQWLTGVFGLDD